MLQQLHKGLTISIVSFWNSVLLPPGVEAGISVRELEINTSTLLVCSAQLMLPVSLLLCSSPPTEELLGEQEFSASTSFSKIWFVISHSAEASYNHLLLTKVKSTLRRLIMINWGPLHIMFFYPSSFPHILQMISHCRHVFSSQAASSPTGTAVPLLVQLWPQGLMLSGAKRLQVSKATCRPWENHCCGNDLILAAISQEKAQVSNMFKLCFSPHCSE